MTIEIDHKSKSEFIDITCLQHVQTTPSDLEHVRATKQVLSDGRATQFKS